MVLGHNESVHICESLSDVEVLERLSGPVREWLRVTIVSVLKNVEQAFQILANLVGIPSRCGGFASRLTADPQEYRSILLVPELIVNKIPLGIGSVVAGIEMIDFISEIQ